MPVSSSTEHWIKPDALTINLNHFGDPDYLQVSVLAGAVVMAFKQDVIGYNAAHNYRTWALEAANTYLETSSAYNVYARLTRSEVNARALVVYDTVLRDIEGREISYAEDGREILGVASPDYFFLFLGQISESINYLGEKINRKWTTYLRFGVLDTTEQKNDLGLLFNRMFVPHFDNPNNPEELTWIEALSNLGVAGGVVSYLDNKKLNLPSIYDGLPIDWSTIYWEEVKDSDGNVTGRVLKAAGGGGSGEGGDIVVEGITIEQVAAYLETNKYATQPWVEGKGYLTSITSAMVTGALGFTPFDAASFTKANIKSKLGIADWALESSKPSYTYSEISGLGDELAKYIPISGYTEILGEKNFVGGLKVNGCPIVYDATNKYWKFEGDLIVTGGVTTHASDSAFKPSTIMDALMLDSTTLGINDDGELYVKGSGGGLIEVHWSDVIDRPTKLSQFTDDVVSGKYLPLSGGTLTGSGNNILVINRTDGWPYIRFSNNGAGLAYFGVNNSKEMVFIPQNSADILKVLHSGNYNSYALPLSGGIINGAEQIPLKITTSYNSTNSTSPVGLIITNTNKNNANGQNHGTAQFGYFKTAGAYIFNYNDYDNVNCAIGITDDGIAYVGKGGTISTKYKIWHEGNDGSGSGLDADLLDGYHWNDFYRSFIGGINAENLNTFANTKSSGTYSINYNGQYSGLLLSFNSRQGSVSSIELIAPHYDFQIYGLQARIAIDNNRYSALRTFAFTDSNVASATKLQTARTIWGQSFDGTGNVSGDLYLNNGKNIMTYNSTGNAYSALTLGATNNLSIGLGTCAIGQTYIDGKDVIIQTYSDGLYERISIMQDGNVGISVPATTIGEFTLSTLRSKSHFRLHHNNIFGVYMMVDYNSGAFAMQSGYQNQAKALDIVLQPRGGKIGIGTTTPSSTLDVKGGVSAQSFGGYNGNTNISSSYRWAIYQWNNELQITRRDSSDTFLSTMLGFDLESGNVGLGITNPSQKLHVNGNILGHAIYFANGTTYYLGSTGNINCNTLTANGATTLKSTLGVTGAVTMESNLLVKGHVTSYSQRSLKNVIDERGLSLEELATIKPTRYTWKDGRDKLVYIGGIADDVQKVLPEVVFDNNGTLTMDYAMAGFAIAASLIKPVAKHEEDIESLKKRIKELELEVERLTMN